MLERARGMIHRIKVTPLTGAAARGSPGCSSVPLSHKHPGVSVSRPTSAVPVQRHSSIAGLGRDGVPFPATEREDIETREQHDRA
jgi:hypothetical protein